VSTDADLSWDNKRVWMSAFPSKSSTGRSLTLTLIYRIYRISRRRQRKKERKQVCTFINRYCSKYTARRPTPQSHLWMIFPMNYLPNNGCKFIIFRHLEGSTFSVSFTMLQINNNLTARCLCTVGCIVVIYYNGCLWPVRKIASRVAIFVSVRQTKSGKKFINEQKIF
jgi:hypothetical protein